jgi:hypothetical protein
MTATNAPGSMSDDARMLAVATAAASERRNNPRYLVYAAGAVFAISLLYLVSSWSSWSAARSLLLKQQADRATIARNVSELRKLKAASGADTGPRLAEQESSIRSRIRDIGKSAGLKEENITPKTVKRDARKDLGSVLLTAAFEARDDSLAPLLGWLEKATAEMPGLEVYKISIKPEAQKWVMQVTFSRWEKPEAK